MTRLFAAPLQGYTEAPFRHFHAEVYGCDGVTYITPFVRIEKGEPRRRDIRDIISTLNAGQDVIPQIIFRDAQEFATLTNAVVATGFRHLNLNMGCPFAPQCHKGRGAAVTANNYVLEQVCDMMLSMPDITFSIKMRLGLEKPDEWRMSAKTISRMPLQFIAVHPRTASQQYGGELHLDQLQPIADTTGHAIIMNGDIRSWRDIERISNDMPMIEGIMAGRGLLGRPSLFNEYAERNEWPRDRRIEHLHRLHTLMLEYYMTTLCGDAQILSKIKPFWDYMEDEIGHKVHKLIHKATSLSHYHEAVTRIV